MEFVTYYKWVALKILLSMPKEGIELKIMDAWKQNGTNDCRLFVIAFNMALCFGELPSGLVFGQSLMKKHLFNCMENSEVAKFPVWIE